ncbi:MAG: O-antigen ligase family protein [Desulfobulbaceae bacterium]|nr:O-antigen ligase family protein [Desulfobulbaceae bacterium]
MAALHGTTSRLEKAGIYSVIASCFFIPLSTTLMGLFGGLVLLFWIISGSISRWPQLIRQSPLTAVATILIILFGAGMLYSPAPWEEILNVFKKYRELFFIPAVTALMLKDDRNFNMMAVTAFFAGCIILLAVSYAMSFGIMPSDRYGNSIIQHIAHSFFMAILAFWAAHKAFDAAEKHKPGWMLLLAVVVGNIVYIAPGRTGMITFLVLCLLFIWQRFSWQKQMLAFLVFAGLTGIAFISSNNVQTRFYDALDDIQTYEHGMSRTSQGRRFDWWYDSLRLLGEKPLIGHGTGSFTVVHDRLIEGTAIHPTDNPHNEYLLISVQLGGVGLLAFLALFAAGWLDSLRQTPEKQRLAQGVIISMMVGCLMNSFLFDSHQGHYFAFLAALLCAPAPLNFRKEP